MSFYLWAMRGASVILFVIALVTIFASLMMTGSMIGRAGAMASYPALNGLELLGAFAGAFQNAVWPLFGAALLWRIDLWLKASGKGPAQ